MMTATQTTEPAKDSGAEVGRLKEEIRQYRQRLQQPLYVSRLLMELLQKAQAEDDRYVAACLTLTGIIHMLKDIEDEGQDQSA